MEEHLYLAYFLLVSMRQRFGWPVILAVCLATRVVGLAAHWALKHYGSRYVEGGGTSGWGFHRRLLSEGAAREVEDLPGRGLPSDRDGVAAVSRALSNLTRPGGSHTARTISSEGAG